jgi:anti-sigma factor RsiW
MAQHPDLELSLYLDDALAPEERRQLEAHLAACEPCGTRLAELRGVTRLFAALPQRSPRRSLLPRRAALPGWLIPARWASTLATAVFVIAFVASNLPVGAIRTAAPAAAPLPSGANLAESSAEKVVGRTGSPSPAAVPAYGDFAVSSPPSAAPQRDAASTATDRATVQPRGPAVPTEPAATSFTTSPVEAPRWLWLVPAALFAAIAVGLQWRIRQVR